jgi:predicted RecB family nuclease
MAPTITPDIVIAYAQCPRKAFLLLFSPDKGEPHAYVQMLKQQRGTHQERYIDHLKHTHTDVEPYSVENLRKGNKVLINAHLQVDGFVAECGALSRVEGTSTFGKHSYEPLLCVGTHRISKEQKLELAFVGYVLERLQHTSPAAGRIIGLDGKSHTIKLGESSASLTSLLAPLLQWTTVPSPKPPPVILNHHCPTCQFQRMCRAQAIQEDHLSLLGGITPKEIRKFNSKGLFTIKQLSYTFRPRRIRKRPSHYTRPHSFELQALALQNRKIYVHETPILPQSTVEIYFDIEAIPDCNFYYLIGLVVKEESKIDHHFFWADNSNEEIAIFQKFLSFLGQYSDYILFHYGSYDYKYLQKMIKRIENKELRHPEKILKSCCNILSFLHSNIYLPTYTNGLKEVANFLGFQWTDENASGLQSIVWRKRWEENQDDSLKNRLLIYNKQDCYALIEVKKLIRSIIENEHSSHSKNYEIEHAHSIKRNKGFSFKDKGYASSEIELINKHSSFDYQRERVHIREDTIKKKYKSKIQRKEKEKSTIDRFVKIFANLCPKCGDNKISEISQVLSKTILDLEFFDYGVRRLFIEYATHKYKCLTCLCTFLPEEYSMLRWNFGHSFKCWVIYQHIINMQSFKEIKRNIKEIFQISISEAGAHYIKKYMKKYYEITYDKILQNILKSHVIYVDETLFNMRYEEGYAWIFTNGKEVISMYKESQEGDFLKDLLQNFRGVLVSDFFSAYYSIDCPQQKCLIHLIRDLNDDLLKNPFDDEFKGITRHFTLLLQNIIQTIDKYGLKNLYLHKHHREVDIFFDKVSSTVYTSEVSKQYQVRFEKNRNTLFTFLDYDNVSWNNTYAEHAIKLLATHRNKNIDFFRASRMDEYLRIMSIYQTCEYKKLSFLKFLLSKETDMDDYCRNNP